MKPEASIFVKEDGAYAKRTGHAGQGLRSQSTSLSVSDAELRTISPSTLVFRLVALELSNSSTFIRQADTMGGNEPTRRENGTIM